MAGDRRRLAAIVVADVAGYSRLMGRDESGTLAALKAVLHELIEPKLGEHSGRLVKTMGDGLLLEFSSAVNAVACSVDVQRAMAKRNADVPPERLLQFRFGINLGDIIIEGEDIFGDGVNVAARVQTLAQPGGICVSKAVHDQVRGKLDVAFDSLGAQEVKNIALPVEVYQVRLDGASSGASGRDRSRVSPFTATVSKWVGGGLVVAGLAGLAVWIAPRLLGSSGAARSPPALSVSIAPLKAQGTDASRFAEALGRYLKNRLASGSSARLRVMASGPSNGPAEAVAPGELAFRYVIHGDITDAGGRFDVHLRLLDAVSGDQVWSTQEALRESDLSAGFTPRLNALSARLRTAVFDSETRRVIGLPLSKLTAPELVLRTWAVYSNDRSLSGVREAQKIVDEALRLDPGYAPAWYAKAVLVNMEGDVDPQQDRDRIGREQDLYTARAVTLDATNARFWDMRATALAYLARWDGALEAASASFRSEPHDVHTRLTYAWIRGLMGRPDESLAIVEEVLKTDPESQNTGAMRVACEANVLAGRAAAAVSACEKDAAMLGDWITIVYLIAAYANNGEMAKAKDAKGELLRVVPGYTIAQLRAKRYSDHPDYLVLAEKNWYAGLRKAGIPEK